MTSTSIGAPMAHDPGFPVARKLINCGSEIGALMRRVSYLAKSVSDASDEITTPDERSRAELDRMLVFVEMMEESADKASDMAEAVEKIGLDQLKEA